MFMFIIFAQHVNPTGNPSRVYPTSCPVAADKIAIAGFVPLGSILKNLISRFGWKWFMILSSVLLSFSSSTPSFSLLWSGPPQRDQKIMPLLLLRYSKLYLCAVHALPLYLQPVNSSVSPCMATAGRRTEGKISWCRVAVTVLFSSIPLAFKLLFFHHTCTHVYLNSSMRGDFIHTVGHVISLFCIKPIYYMLNIGISVVFYSSSVYYYISNST